MTLRPGDLRFDHPKITRRFFEGGSLVWWAFMPKSPFPFR